MSLRTLPILFFTLGGEMLYILDQRLRAQTVLPEKAAKVMLDIAGQMFDERCVKEIFRPQKVFAKRSLRTVFERLAHASIMKLNSTAMDKLYDLMVMGVKYQVLLCKRGEDVILVTLNHLDAIRELVSSSDTHVAMVNSACRILTDYYARLTPAQFMQLRFTLLTVFQDTHKRVSIFLKNKAQLSSGRFVVPVGGPVPHGFNIPGIIKYYDGGSCITESFTPPHHYDSAEPEGSREVTGNRVTTLGTNVYVSDRSIEPAVTSAPTQIEEEEVVGNDESSDADPLVKAGSSHTDPLVKAELHLLETLLMGIRSPSAGKPGEAFKFKLFPHLQEEDEETRPKKEPVINPSTKGRAELNKIMQDLTIQDSSEGAGDDDLLDLLDQAT